MKSKTAIVLILALVVGSTLAIGTASAAHVSCGDVIASNTTLDANLTCTGGDGLVIGAAGVVLDLGGYSLSGDCTAIDLGVGVRTDGYSNVTVRNGTVQCFDAGIVIEGLPRGSDARVGANNTVTDLVVQDNKGDPTTDFGDGVLIAGSSFNKVENNTIVRNGPYDGVGIIGLVAAAPTPADNNKIEGNTISDNNVQFSNTTNQDSGVRVEPGTTNNRVEGNTITGNGLEGIAVFDRTPGTIVKENYVANNGHHNKAHRKGDGIRLFSPTEAQVIENTVCANAANGIFAGRGTNSITDNNVGVGTSGCTANASAAGTFNLSAVPVEDEWTLISRIILE